MRIAHFQTSKQKYKNKLNYQIQKNAFRLNDEKRESVIKMKQQHLHVKVDEVSPSNF